VPKNVNKWWEPLSVRKLYGADDEGDDSAADSQEEDDGDDDSDVDDSPVTFDQAYVDKLRKENADRRIKAKEASEKATALETELAKIKEAEMNDIEKAQAAVEAATKKSADAEARAVDAEGALRETTIQTAVTVAAMEANFQDPSDALSMIPQDGLLDEEGEISDKAVKASLGKLAKAKPYLLKAPGKGSGDGGPTGRPADKQGFEAKQKAYLEEFTTTGGRVPAA